MKTIKRKLHTNNQSGFTTNASTYSGFITFSCSPNPMRQGIAFKLCKEVGWVVKDEWGFDKLHLRVESSNNVVRALYVKHLNYRLEWFEKGAIAL
jgi:hypothetical protein